MIFPEINEEVMNFPESFNVGDFTNIPEEGNGILFDRARDFLIGMQESIYEDGNIEKLEHCLGELCEMFDVDFKPQSLKVINKEFSKKIFIHLGEQKSLMNNKKYKAV